MSDIDPLAAAIDQVLRERFRPTPFRDAGCYAVDATTGSRCERRAVMLAGPDLPPHPFTGQRVQLCAEHAAIAGAGRVIDLARPPQDSGWGITFMTMFDMAADSHLFMTADDLAAMGCVRRGNSWVCPAPAPTEPVVAAPAPVMQIGLFGEESA